MSSNWHILWTKTFKKDYEKYPFKDQLKNILASLQTNPFSGQNIKILQGEWIGFYRYRKGDYRLIYQIQEEDSRIILVAFSARGSVY